MDEASEAAVNWIYVCASQIDQKSDPVWPPPRMAELLEARFSHVTCKTSHSMLQAHNLEALAQAVLSLVCGATHVSKLCSTVSPLVLRTMLGTVTSIGDSKGWTHSHGGTMTSSIEQRSFLRGSSWSRSQPLAGTLRPCARASGRW